MIETVEGETEKMYFEWLQKEINFSLQFYI